MRKIFLGLIIFGASNLYAQPNEIKLHTGYSNVSSKSLEAAVLAKVDDEGKLQFPSIKSLRILQATKSHRMRLRYDLVLPANARLSLVTLKVNGVHTVRCIALASPVMSQDQVYSVALAIKNCRSETIVVPNIYVEALTDLGVARLKR